MIFNIPPMPSFGKDTHAYWDGALSEEDINLILAHPEWLSVTRGRVGAMDGVENSAVMPDIRETDIAWMSPDTNNIHIWDRLANVTAKVNAQFFKFDLDGFYEPAQLGYYSADKKSHYTWHTDTSVMDVKAPRKLSMVLMLSDPSEFEGGELQIKTDSDVARTLQQVKGRIWFFPSYTLHRVTPVTKGKRRTLVLWVGGPEFR